MTTDFQPGDWVLCQWQGGHLWFPGVVHSVNGGSVAIQYDDGTSEIRPANQVKPFDWEVGSAHPRHLVGQRPMVRGDDHRDGGERPGLTVRFEDGIIEKTVTGRCRSRMRLSPSAPPGARRSAVRAAARQARRG